MKCPLCGAWSTVLSTRENRRRRECANHHRFSTIETVTTAVTRNEKLQRNEAITKDPRTNVVVAKEYGISKTRVNYIRMKYR